MSYYSKSNKYSNNKITIDGETFDSKKEYRRYRELKLLEMAGEIAQLKRQERFLLIPAHYEEMVDANGKTKRKCIERECCYVADFVYRDLKTGKHVVEDVKSEATKKKESYIIKRKLMLYIRGIKILET